jgi:hypothetical protein
MQVFTTALLAVLLSGQVASASAADVQLTRSSLKGSPTKGARVKPKPETLASWQARHGLFFRRNWGVEIVGIRRVSSGLMLRFNYRVLDPARAVALNDKKARAYLIDEATQTALSVPAMENVGELRQVAPYQPNRIYFIIFGNPGGLVKHNSRVTLVVGNLRAEGLVVE